MRVLVKRGRRWFAVPKPLGLADRLAAQTQLRGNWGNVERNTPGSRVISNLKRQ